LIDDPRPWRCAVGLLLIQRQRIFTERRRRRDDQIRSLRAATERGLAESTNVVESFLILFGKDGPVVRCEPSPLPLFRQFDAAAFNLVNRADSPSVRGREPDHRTWVAQAGFGYLGLHGLSESREV
jgi:hypothetical protein